MRILIVEDDRDLNKIISKKLKAEGFTVEMCIRDSLWTAPFRASAAECLFIQFSERGIHHIPETRQGIRHAAQ